MSTEESLLIQQLKNEATERKAFSVLVNKYQEGVYHTIRRILVDHDDTNDALQTTFIKAWKNRHQFDENASYFTWLYRIATNEALQLLRKKKNAKTVGSEHMELLLETAVSYGGLDASEVEIKLEKALLRLPDKQRLVFNLKYFDDLKYEQIAEITDTSVGALKASYHLAVKKIEDYLNKHE